ncbi:hypothetical protein JTB14_000590 [Gonioctena quinquepunctata]|nr:hypothetical protein JTB14_000590 [Gonioctena quinquepunctata]
MADDEERITIDDSSSTSDIIEIYEPRLDFFSDEFDPLFALKAPNADAAVPDSTAKKYDNIAAYKAAIYREENPREIVKKRDVTKDVLPTERRWKEHQMPIQTTRKKKTMANLFTRMDEAKGPYGVLKKCMDEKLRIKVWTRSDRRIRGYCLAYLVAFDKFWNMALEDVTEYWSRPKKRKVPAFDSLDQDVNVERIMRKRILPPKIKVFPHESDKKLESCVRHVDQLMIRGEQVVFVNVVDNAQKNKSDRVAASEKGRIENNAKNNAANEEKVTETISINSDDDFLEIIDEDVGECSSKTKKLMK